MTSIVDDDFMDERGPTRTTDHEYRGLMAATWDDLRRDSPRWEDRGFYLKVIQQYGEPVLDVGCGTGRLLLDYLAAGIDIDGVDCSPEMLALCRQKAGALSLRSVLYEQYMEALALPRTYRTILVPSSSFQLLTEVEGAREAMRRFRAHLQPGGVLVMPFMILWREGDPQETPWQVREARRDDGVVVRRRSRSRYEPARRLEHTEDTYELERAGAVVRSEHYRRSPAVRWYTQAEARALYHEAGVADVRGCHGFTFEPARADDPLFCLLGVASSAESPRDVNAAPVLGDRAVG